MGKVPTLFALSLLVMISLLACRKETTNDPSPDDPKAGNDLKPSVAPKPDSDECQQVYDKEDKMFNHMGIPETHPCEQQRGCRDKVKDVKDCRADQAERDDPVFKCVLAAKEDDAVKACLDQTRRPN